MGKAKHTPGPWNTSDDGYGSWKFQGGYRGTIKSADGEVVFAGPASFNALRGKTPEQTEANARLMAAAPELLEALRDVLEYMPSLTAFQRERIRRAERAIANAEGRA